MAEYTNLGLVKHVKAALKLNTMYMWGGILREITERYITQVSGIKGYEKQYPESRKAKLRAVIGKKYYGVDCVGLIKSYYWSGKSDGGTGSPNYPKIGEKTYPDVNANIMYNAAKVKGPIATMPETPGIIVYSKTNPHVGVYIGNGEVIESTLGSRGDGVVKTKLKDFKWEYWFECPYITYKNSVKATVSRCKLAYHAVARSAPSVKAEDKGKLAPGTWVTVIVGSDTVDEESGYTYVKVARGSGYQWIVKSALEK